MSVATTADVTVAIGTSGTGTEGTDYSTISDITISAGSTTGTVSFTPTDDSTYEGNETGIVAISTVSGGSATEDGNQSVTITITENESAPTVTLTSSASSIAENAGSSLTLTQHCLLQPQQMLQLGYQQVEQELRELTTVQYQILLFLQVLPRNSIFHTH